MICAQLSSRSQYMKGVAIVRSMYIATAMFLYGPSNRKLEMGGHEGHKMLVGLQSGAMPEDKLCENGCSLEWRDARTQALREWLDSRGARCPKTSSKSMVANRVARCPKFNSVISMVGPQSGAMPETSSVGGAVAHEWDQLDIDVMENFVVSANRGHGNCVHLR